MKQTILLLFFVSKIFAIEQIMNLHTIAECGHTHRDFRIVIESPKSNFSENVDYYLSLPDNKLSILGYEIDENKLSFDIESENDENEVNTDDFIQVTQMKFPSLIIKSNSSETLYPLNIDKSWKNAQEDCRKQSVDGKKATIGLASFAVITWIIYILDYLRKKRKQINKQRIESE